MQFDQGAKSLESPTDRLRELWSITPLGDRQFKALERSRNHSNCRIAEIGITPCIGRRGETEIDQAVDDGLYATFYKTGSLLFNAGSDDLILGANDLLLWNPGSPASFSCTAPSLGHTIIFPKDMIERRLGNRYLVGNVHPNNKDPRTVLLKSHILQLLALPDDVDGQFSHSIFELTLELIFLCTADLRQKRAKSSYENSVFNRIIEAIRTSICVYDVTPTNIANIIGMSVRRMQSIIACHGTTFTSILMRERLDLAAEYLISPLWNKRSLTDLACHLGFYDGSHFSNAFKRRFNMSPREFRNSH